MKLRKLQQIFSCKGATVGMRMSSLIRSAGPPESLQPLGHSFLTGFMFRFLLKRSSERHTFIHIATVNRGRSSLDVAFNQKSSCQVV